MTGLGHEPVPGDQGVAHVEETRSDDDRGTAHPDGAGDHGRDDEHVGDDGAGQLAIGARPHLAQDHGTEHGQHRHDHDDANEEAHAVNALDVHPDDVGEVTGQEGGQPEHEEVLRHHEQHVAHQAQHQGDDEPHPHRVGVSINIDGERHAEEQQHRERLADVLEALALLLHGHPVAASGDQSQCEEQEGGAGHARATASPVSHRLPSSTSERSRMTMAGWFIPRTPTTMPSRP